jgi:hypothetical protein
VFKFILPVLGWLVDTSLRFESTGMLCSLIGFPINYHHLFNGNMCVIMNENLSKVGTGRERDRIGQMLVTCL